MATSTTELIMKFTGDPSQLKQTLAQVRADLSGFGQAHVNVVRQTNRQITTEQKSLTREYDKEERERRRAAESLQRQKSAALIAIWKAEQREKARIEREAERRATGQKPFGELLQGLNQSLITIQGPLGGLASRIGSAQTQFQSLSVGATAAGSSIAAIAIPVGAAIAAIAALGAAASAGIEGLKGLFGLAKDAAEFQGKLFDLSQQTGVSVETLSALEVAARTTGSSIDQIVASLGIFQKNLEESLDPQSKAAEAFKRLDVEVTNTEDTLRATLTALAKMPEGFRQTALALELFGRGGKSVLAILKETNGDIDGTIEKLRGLGLVTSEQARKADQFNDQLVLLQVALRGLGTDAIPHVSSALVKLQKTINENKGAVDFLKAAIGFLAGSFSLQLETAVKTGESVWRSHRAEVNIIIEAYQILRNTIRGVAAEIPKIAIPLQEAESGLRLLRELKQFGVPLKEKQDFSKIPELFLPDPEKERAAAQTRANKAIQLQQQLLEESTRHHREQLERERQLDLKSIDEWEQESLTALADHQLAQFRIFEQELADARRFIKDKADLLLAEGQIALKQKKLANDTAREIQRVEDEAKRRRDQAALSLERQLAAIREAEREGELRRIEAALERQEITEAEAITRRLALEKQAQEDRLILLNAELDSETTSLERKTEIINEKIRLEQRYTDELKRLIKERNEARERDIAKQAPGAQGVPEQKPPFEVLPGELPPPPDFNPWKDAIEQLQKQLAGFSQFVSGTVVEAINGIGRALGDGLAAWILYGEGFGKAMRQSLALVAAKIAAEAALQAVLHAAYAIGSLAFGDYVGAAKHALAAAKFGAVAAGAAIIGRVIAGNSFTGGSSGSGGGGSSAREPAPPLTTIIRGRGQEPSPTVRHIFEVRVVDSELGPAINAHIVRNVGDGGELREVIQRDGR